MDIAKGNGAKSAGQISPGLGDRYLFLWHRAGAQTMDIVANEDMKVVEMLELIIGGLVSIGTLLAQRPEFQKSPIIQPFAVAKKLGEPQ
jgi:hypothetical protein